jgi:hypothetical protein
LGICQRACGLEKRRPRSGVAAPESGDDGFGINTDAPTMEPLERCAQGIARLGPGGFVPGFDDQTDQGRYMRRIRELSKCQEGRLSGRVGTLLSHGHKIGHGFPIAPAGQSASRFCLCGRLPGRQMGNQGTSHVTVPQYK